MAQKNPYSIEESLRIGNADPITQGQGWAVYSPEAFVNRSARDKHGTLRNAKVKVLNNWFSLDPWQCLEIFKLNHNVFSLVTQRSQILAGLDRKVVPSRSIEDEIADDLKALKWRYDQIDDADINLYSKARKEKYYLEIWRYLGSFELKQDLSNFTGCLRMWSKFQKKEMGISCAQIEDWMQVTKKFEIVDEGVYREANVQGFNEYVLQWAQDMLIHGRAATQNPNDFFDGLWVLPGGSVFPVPGIKAGMPEFYIQLMYGMSGYGMQEPQFFLPTDLAMSFYMPNSAVVYGMKPLDAVVQQISENFNFATFMAEHANQEKPPQYVIFVVDSNMQLPTGEQMNDFTKVDPRDLERQEQILNEKQKDKAVRMLKQKGNDAKLFDLSKENTIADHAAREDKIEKIIGRVFGATPNELGVTDTGGMIAKAGAESQRELYNLQSIKPLATALEKLFTFEIFPNRFGKMTDNGGRPILWELRHMSTDSDSEKFAKAKEARDSLSVSANEIRETILGMDPTSNPADDELPTSNASPSTDDLMNSIKELKELRKKL
ncbi:phage portal protein [Leptospira andrefontaineae]|uniref:Phage portal protein n=1 Tax=Leptospira andrefontaineae TaxID=2484976 RepID=A0A4R9GWZ0_9LEPT|nr:phage portal protein [Leptospira andrefontaineae]TGK36231.1 phage portal protein [Leptospira andrefontaineae]